MTIQAITQSADKDSIKMWNRRLESTYYFFHLVINKKYTSYLF